MCVTRGTGLAKLSALPPVAAPCCLQPACTAGMGSHSRLPTFERWSRGCGSPRPPQPLWGPAGTYWIFLVKFLETIPPSTCCSSCLPAGKDNTPRHHLTGRLFFPQQTTTEPNSKVFRGVVSLPLCKPFALERAQGASPTWGRRCQTQRTHVSSESLGSRRLPRAGA